MANYSSTITFGGVSLNILAASPTKKQKTYKNTIGKTLVQNNVVGMNAFQWQLRITGILIGDSATDLSSKRAALEALDDVGAHVYVDGIHDGDYIIIPGTLQFDDSGDNNAGFVYRYTFQIVED